MKIIKIICFFFLLLITIKCQEKTEEAVISTIDLTKSFEKETKINLSTIAEKIEYVQLESDSAGLLDRIKDINKDIQFFNDNILIKDVQNNLILFDGLGDFKAKVGALGEGPGEYTRIEETIALPDKNLIAVYSAGQQKAFMYNLEGEFDYSFELDFWPTGLSYFNENLIFFNTIGRRDLADYYALSLLDVKGNLVERLHFKEKEKEYEKNNKLGLKTLRLNSFILNDTLRFWEGDYDRDVIWSLTKENTILPYTSIIYDDDNLWTLDLYLDKKIMSFEEMIRYSNIEKLYESNRYLFLRIPYAKDNKGHSIFYNKQTKESHWVRYKNNNGKGGHSKFYNDIDGGLPFWPQGKASSDKMYMLIYGYELKDYISKQMTDININDHVGREKLLELANKATISDNPILMIVTLKK